MDIDVGAPLLRSDLLRSGITDDEVRRALRTGTLSAVRPGVYLRADDPRLTDPDARYRALVIATARRLDGDRPVSHLSAAALHGFPVRGVGLRTVHLTQDARSGGRRSNHVQVHAAPLALRDVTRVDGTPVTSPARTVVDVACTEPFETAVVIADAALRSGLVTPDELVDTLARIGRRCGGPGARRVLAFADGLADGPGESRSRVGMARHGVPPPVLQHEIRDRAGRLVGRVDFWWPREGLIGEFDGEVKYRRLARPGEDPADVVVREKRREDALRAVAGVRTVVRWAWSDLDRFAPVAARLRP